MPYRKGTTGGSSEPEKEKSNGEMCPELIRKFFRNSGVTSVIWGYTLSLCGFIRKLFAVFDFFSRF